MCLKLNSFLRNEIGYNHILTFDPYFFQEKFINKYNNQIESLKREVEDCERYICKTVEWDPTRTHKLFSKKFDKMIMNFLVCVKIIKKHTSRSWSPGFNLPSTAAAPSL